MGTRSIEKRHHRKWVRLLFDSHSDAVVRWAEMRAGVEGRRWWTEREIERVITLVFHRLGSHFVRPNGARRKRWK